MVVSLLECQEESCNIEHWTGLTSPLIDMLSNIACLHEHFSLCMLLYPTYIVELSLVCNKCQIVGQLKQKDWQSCV